MIYYRIIITTLFIINSVSTYSQIIKGKVVDNKGKALSFVSIYAKNKPYGTTSNIKGEFLLKTNINTDTIIFSYIGYNTKEVTVSSLKTTNYIELTPTTYNIEEVTIKAPELERIIYNVIANKQINYPNKNYNTKSFYRELLFVDSNIYQLSEASCLFSLNSYNVKNDNKKRFFDTKYWDRGVNIYFDACNLGLINVNSHQYEKVKIIENRNSNNFSEGIFKINISGGPLTVTAFDLFRQGLFPFKYFKRYKKYKRKLNKDFNIKYSYVNLDSNLIYKISLTKKDSTETFNLYIDNENHTLISYNISVLKQTKIQWPVNLIIGEYNTETNDSIIVNTPSDFKFNYRKYNNRYYLSSAVSKVRYSFYRNNYGKRKNITEYRLLVTNNIITDKYTEIKENENFDCILSNYLYNLKTLYNNTYWDNYQTFTPTKLEKEILSKIESKNSLKKQFAENYILNVPIPIPQKIKDTIIIHGDTLIDNYLYLDYNDSLRMNYIQQENNYYRNNIKKNNDNINNIYKELKRLNIDYKRWTDEYSEKIIHNNYTYEIRNNAIIRTSTINKKESIFFDLNTLDNILLNSQYAYLSIMGDTISILQYQDLLGIKTFFIDINSKKIIDMIPHLLKYYPTKNRNLILYTAIPIGKTYPTMLIKYNFKTHEHDTIYSSDNLYTHLSDDKKYLIIGNKFYVSINKTQSLERFIDTNFKYINHYDNIWVKWQYDNNKYLSTEYLTDLNTNSWLPFIISSGFGDIGKKLVFSETEVFYEEQNKFTKDIKKINLVNKEITTITSSKSDLYTYSLLVDNNYKTNGKIRIEYNEYFKPTEIFEYSTNNKKMKSLVKDTLLHVDLTQFTSKIIYAKTRDNIKIPILLKYKKGIKLDSKNKLIVETYGSYTNNFKPSIDLSQIPMIKRDYVFAWAIIRGESEVCESWSNAKPEETISDFETCINYLLKKKYTDENKLFIKGTSNGGRIGADITNKYPNKIRAVSLNVPDVDVLNRCIKEKSNISFLGNINTVKGYYRIKKFSPYNNITKSKYPNIIVFSGLLDGHVKNKYVVRYVAKLRNTVDVNKLLFITYMNSGHNLTDDGEIYRKSVMYNFFENSLKEKL